MIRFSNATPKHFVRMGSWSTPQSWTKHAVGPYSCRDPRFSLGTLSVPGNRYMRVVPTALLNLEFAITLTGQRSDLLQNKQSSNLSAGSIRHTH